MILLGNLCSKVVFVPEDVGLYKKLVFSYLFYGDIGINRLLLPVLKFIFTLVIPLYCLSALSSWMLMFLFSS